MTEARFHEVASIFPMMSTAEIDRLAEDIKANGLREPIWLDKPNGLVIDGRNRLEACRRADVEPRFRVWDGKGKLVAFVVSLNLHRRHLNESQRSMVADKLAQLPKGVRSDASIEASATQEEAAELLNVSRSAVQRAREVHTTGTPELVEAVERGDVSVSAAAQVASLPPERQREIVAKGEGRQIAAEMRKTEPVVKPSKQKPGVIVSELLRYLNDMHERWPEGESRRHLIACLRQAADRLEKLEAQNGGEQ